MKKFSAVVNHVKNKLINKVYSIKKIIGILFIYYGESLIGGLHTKYRFISTIVENVHQSQDVAVRVKNYFENPLFVRFQLKVITPKNYDIDGDYFKSELALQLGCPLSDISTGIEDNTYYVDITNTAIQNLEKGCTPFMPQGYEQHKYDSLLEDAKEIVLKDKITSIPALQRKLRIGYARAARIMDELQEMGVIGKGEINKPRKLIN